MPTYLRSLPVAIAGLVWVAAAGAQSDAGFRLAEDGPGVEFGSAKGSNYANAWLRSQLRFSNPFDSDPRLIESFDTFPGASIELRRARLKMQGHLFSSDVRFAYEQSLTDDLPLLTLRLDLRFENDFRVRAGQYKAVYNRERVDSSGKQQFVERSIVNRVFTLDRQRGITLGKRFFTGQRFDSWIDAGVFDGEGRRPGTQDSDPLYVARWQWQIFGRELSFAQGDIGFRERPAATLALAGARVRGPYTRYSGAGGGQLDGFGEATNDDYDIRQWLQEFAWQFAGMSLQQEYHEKRITDRISGERSLIRGGYLQFGRAWPLQLGQRERVVELAARVARVTWDNSLVDRSQDEVTLAANLFFDGHRHKLSADISRLEVEEAGSAGANDIRFRLQWDLSF